MSAAITTRQTAGTGATVKGSPLTNTEVDTNFINLNTAIDTKAAAGANSDITSLTGITGAIGTADYVQFDINPATVPTTPGALYWDAADGNQTLSLVMAGGTAVQQIGEEQYYRIKASSAITNGQVIMFTGTVGASGSLTGAPATGLTAATASYVMGIATQDIALNGWGYVTSFGVVRGLNTSAFTDGQILYLDPTVPGGLTATLPTAPSPKVQVCACIYAHATNGALFIRPAFGGTLGQYEGDVQITGGATNDILQRNGSGVWINVTPATARTNLGLAIGTNVQAWDADLDAIAALAGTSGLLRKTAANTWSLDTSAYLTGNQSITISGDASGSGTTAITLTLANSGVGAGTYNNVTVNAKGLVTSGSNVSYQPLDDDLTAIAALTGTSGFLKTNGAGTWSVDTATYLTGNQTITLSGDVTGSGATAITATLANSGVTAGTYASPASVVVDAKGRITSITAGSAGGLTISDDTTTNATRYLTFTSATTGSISSENVSSTKLTFNPSTGTLTATAVSASSDESLKTNWRDLRADFVELLAAVKHGTYDRVDADVTQDGVSAQSLRPVLPNSVTVGANGKLAVNYGNAALVSAIKLAERLLALEARVDKLIEG